MSTGGFLMVRVLHPSPQCPAAGAYGEVTTIADTTAVREAIERGDIAVVAVQPQLGGV